VDQVCFQFEGLNPGDQIYFWARIFNGENPILGKSTAVTLKRETYLTCGNEEFDFEMVLDKGVAPSEDGDLTLNLLDLIIFETSRNDDCPVDLVFFNINPTFKKLDHY